MPRSRAIPLSSALILSLALIGCGSSDMPGHDMTTARLDHLLQQTRANDQVLVVDLWATWCLPCMEMFGPLHEGIESLGDNVRLVSVSYDEPKLWDTKIKDFLEKHHATEDAYLLAEGDAGDAFNKSFEFNVSALPVVLIYTPDGKLAHAFRGGEEAFDADDVVKRVRELTTK